MSFKVQLWLDNRRQVNLHAELRDRFTNVDSSLITGQFTQNNWTFQNCAMDLFYIHPRSGESLLTWRTASQVVYQSASGYWTRLLKFSFWIEATSIWLGRTSMTFFIFNIFEILMFYNIGKPLRNINTHSSPNLGLFRRFKNKYEFCACQRNYIKALSN